MNGGTSKENKTTPFQCGETTMNNGLWLRRMVTRENDQNENINGVWPPLTLSYRPLSAHNTSSQEEEVEMLKQLTTSILYFCSSAGGWRDCFYFLCLGPGLYVISYPWDPLSPPHCLFFVSHSNSRQRKLFPAPSQVCWCWSIFDADCVVFYWKSVARPINNKYKELRPPNHQWPTSGDILPTLTNINYKHRHT